MGCSRLGERVRLPVHGYFCVSRMANQGVSFRGAGPGGGRSMFHVVVCVHGGGGAASDDEQLNVTLVPLCLSYFPTKLGKTAMVPLTCCHVFFKFLPCLQFMFSMANLPCF